MSGSHERKRTSERIAVPINELVDRCTPNAAVRLVSLAMVDLALVESLILIHGKDAGLERYERLRGNVFLTEQGASMMVDSTDLRGVRP